MKAVAALIFFTRLPLYRWFEVPAEYYKNLVAYWSMAGWVTAALTAGTLWICSMILPYPVAVIMAMAVRLLLTGALHEDGLADFFDGFGAGGTRERILAIMKDSHIGTYGVIGLIFYFALWFALISSLSPLQAVVTILVADPGAKFISSLIINRLPYARKVEESKVQVIYEPMKLSDTLLSAFFGLLPIIVLLPILNWLVIVPPVLFLLLFTGYLKTKIGGYTGDCCGALFLFNELIIITSLICIYQWN